MRCCGGGRVKRETVIGGNERVQECGTAGSNHRKRRARSISAIRTRIKCIRTHGARAVSIKLNSTVSVTCWYRIYLLNLNVH